MKSTNYYNTFIEVAEDCPVFEAEIPIQKGEDKTVPLLQYEMISKNPYRYTQDDILFEIFAIRKGINKNDPTEREIFFSKGQACLRSSSLGKRYGWGVHCDANGKVAIYAVGSEEYQKLKSDKRIKQIKAMRTNRVK